MAQAHALLHLRSIGRKGDVARLCAPAGRQDRDYAAARLQSMYFICLPLQRSSQGLCMDFMMTQTYGPSGGPCACQGRQIEMLDPAPPTHCCTCDRHIQAAQAGCWTGTLPCQKYAL